jgi:ABC-type cobalamin/Fe3+-siderophores transport system ATPase subunit
MTRISAEDVTVARGGATLLAGASLALGPTGSVAVIGPNGAGKSTLLKGLAGLAAPTAGTVRVDGHDLARLPANARARQIGYIPQHFEPHWDLGVAELVRLGAARGGDPRGRGAEAAIAAFALAALRHRRWSTLSGGERARVLLAMVLAVDPPVLLADEPGASLDIRHRLDLVRMLAARGRDRLVIVAMHDLDLVFRAFDQVIVLARGRIAVAGPARAVFDDERLDRAFEVRFRRRMVEGDRVLDAI